jgi:hypothetical protein
MPFTARTRPATSCPLVLSLYIAIAPTISERPDHGCMPGRMCTCSMQLSLLRGCAARDSIFLFQLGAAAWLSGGLGCISHRTALSQRMHEKHHLLRPASCVLRPACPERRGRWRAVAYGLAQLALPYVRTVGCDLLGIVGGYG